MYRQATVGEVGSGGGARERDARQPARVGAENRRSQGRTNGFVDL